MSPEPNQAPKGVVNKPANYKTETTKAGFDKNLLHHNWVTSVNEFFSKYQNFIVFGILGICLVAGLLWWRSSQAEKADQKATYATQTADTIDSLKKLVETYGSSESAPFIRFKLANKYMDEGKNAEAQVEYEFIVKNYPKHEVFGLAQKRLEQLKVNEEWAKGEAERMKKELIKKRNLPHLTFKTGKGDFEVELYEDEAPNTVANFVSLAEKGFYNDKGVYEVHPMFGSIFGNNPTEKPDEYSIPFETNHLKHEKGVLAMYRDFTPDTRSLGPEQRILMNPSGSRFYIYNSMMPMVDESAPTGLNGKYPIFGRIVKGLDTALALASTDKITSIIIDYKRDHEYKPKTLSIQTVSISDIDELLPPITPKPIFKPLTQTK